SKANELGYVREVRQAVQDSIFVVQLFCSIQTNRGGAERLNWLHSFLSESTKGISRASTFARSWASACAASYATTASLIRCTPTEAGIGWNCSSKISAWERHATRNSYAQPWLYCQPSPNTTVFTYRSMTSPQSS